MSIRIVAGDSYSKRAEGFALMVRDLRRRADITLQELGERCGLAASTISKIENGQLSPSYESILRLADGLRVDVAELFSVTSSAAMASGRRTVTRRGEGIIHASPQYLYEVLCTELSRKHFVPLMTRITARSIDEFPELLRHDGEEFIYVLSGAIRLYTEHYEPTSLREGDSCYFDSTMGHACISTSKPDAFVVWIASRAEPGAPPASRES